MTVLKKLRTLQDLEPLQLYPTNLFLKFLTMEGENFPETETNNHQESSNDSDTSTTMESESSSEDDSETSLYFQKYKSIFNSYIKYRTSNDRIDLLKCVDHHTIHFFASVCRACFDEESSFTENEKAQFLDKIKPIQKDIVKLIEATPITPKQAEKKTTFYYT